MRERPPRGRERNEQRERGERHVYGVNPVLEALRVRSDEVERLYITEGQLGSRAAAEILSRARDAGIRVERVVRERLATLADGGVHQGVVAELRGFQYAELPDALAAAQASGRPPLLVVLDGIQDPHNFGAIIRSAHALGAHGIITGKDRAVPVTGVVAKASAGAVEHCPIVRVVNISRALEELKEAGVWVAAAGAPGRSRHRGRTRRSPPHSGTGRGWTGRTPRERSRRPPCRRSGRSAGPGRSRGGRPGATGG